MNQAAPLPLDTGATVEALNRILHVELDGVMQEFQYRWMSRCLRGSRERAMAVAKQISALTTGSAPDVGRLLDEALRSSAQMLDAAREREALRLAEYRRLLELVAARRPDLEAFARIKIAEAEAADPSSGGLDSDD